jgi:hypothetical protein
LHNIVRQVARFCRRNEVSNRLREPHAEFLARPLNCPGSIAPANAQIQERTVGSCHRK